MLRWYVVEPALARLAEYHPRMHSAAAVNLMLGTCAQESRMGAYLLQVDGPARGIFQMEPETHQDIRERFIVPRPKLQALVDSEVVPVRPLLDQLVTNLVYAAVMARIHYWRHPAPLPAADDVEGLARYYKLVYNTDAGRGTAAQFIENYHRYCG